MLQLGGYDFTQLLAASGIGSLAWLIGVILGLLIGALGLMIGVRLFGSSESSYGKAFATYFIVWIILQVISLSAILAALLNLDLLIIGIIALVLIIFVCCFYPKIVSSRHDLQSWFKGLIAIIIGAIVAMIINWVLNMFVMGFIPNIILFTI
jgi:hypothetical protein